MWITLTLPCLKSGTRASGPQPIYSKVLSEFYIFGFVLEQFRPDQLEWRGRLKDTHSRKIFDINIKYVGGRKMVLKKLFPRTLHTSGRIRYANIDQVLPSNQLPFFFYLKEIFRSTKLKKTITKL